MKKKKKNIIKLWAQTDLPINSNSSADQLCELVEASIFFLSLHVFVHKMTMTGLTSEGL